MKLRILDKKPFVAGIGVLCILLSVFAGIVLAGNSENYWDHESSEFLNYNSTDLVNSTNVSVDTVNGLATLDYSGNMYQNDIEGGEPLANLTIDATQYLIEITNETYYSANNSIQMKPLPPPYFEQPQAYIEKDFPVVALDNISFFVFETAIKREVVNQSVFYVGINSSVKYSGLSYPLDFYYMFRGNQTITLSISSRDICTNYSDEWYRLKIIVENATLHYRFGMNELWVKVSFYLDDLLLNLSERESLGPSRLPPDDPKTSIWYYIEDDDASLDSAWIDDIRVSTKYYSRGYLYSENISIPEGYEISNITYNATIPKNATLTVEYNESLNCLIAHFQTNDTNVTPTLSSWNIIVSPKIVVGWSTEETISLLVGLVGAMIGVSLIAIVVLSKRR